MRAKHTILLLGLATACHQAPTLLTPAEKTAIIAEVRQTLDDYYADIRQQGLTAEFRYLDASSDFFWVPPGHSEALSYGAIAAILQQNAPLYRSVDNAWDTLRIVPLNRELASYTGRLRSTMTDTSGKVSRFKLVETGLMVKRKDGWKLLSGQTAALQE